MKASSSRTRKAAARLIAAGSALAVLQTATMLAAPVARAQVNACDQFKNTLAARIDPSIHGFTLETVPAGTATPRGAKVVGTCEGGAYKILFRRGGDTRPTVITASAAPAAAVPQAATVDVKVAPVPTPATAAAPAPASTPTPRVAPVPVATPPVPAPTPTAAPVKPAETSASAADATPSADPAPSASAADTALDATATRDAPRFPWRWLWALALLPIAAGLWAWLAHRSAYDSAGLPRGPKL